MNARKLVLPFLALAALGSTTLVGAKTANSTYPSTTVVLDEKSISLTGEINDESIAKVIDKILNNSDKEMTMYINSGGGSIDAGNKLITVMGSSGKKFTCVAGEIASMASAIFEIGCTTRVSTDSSVVMFHQAAYGLPNQQQKRQRSMVGFIEAIVDRLERKQADRLEMKVEDFRAKLDNDWWLYSDQIMDAKAADRQGGIACTAELTKKSHVETRQIFIFTVAVEVNECPLIPEKALAQERR